MRRLIATGLTTLSGGLLFWRRKRLKDDAKRIATAAKGGTASARRRLEDRMISKRVKYAELGLVVHQAHADPEGGDRRAEIDRLLTEIDESITVEIDEIVIDESIDLTDSSSEKTAADQPA